MKNLKTIDDKLIDEYIISHRNDLGKSDVGGTDWRFADYVYPAFKEILDIAQPDTILEIGFNKGGSALMFLSIDDSLTYHSIDINRNDKSEQFLRSKFPNFNFVQMNSESLHPGLRSMELRNQYDMVFIDGDHSFEAVVRDTAIALSYNPKYILFDDVDHPSHSYISDIIYDGYSNRLAPVKYYDLSHCWNGYSFALLKNKDYNHEIGDLHMHI